MKTVQEAQNQFAEIIDTLTNAAEVGIPNLDIELLSSTAKSASKNLAEQERELWKIRSPPPDGRMVFTPDYQALKAFARANETSLEVLADGWVEVDTQSGRVRKLKVTYQGLSNLSAVSGLTSLTELDLSHNRIQDIKPLSCLTSLTRLNLGVNRIQDVKPLSGLTSLTTLSLEGNKIQDLEPLTGLTSLTELHLRDNVIQDIKPLGGLTALTVLTLTHNKIQDMGPLSGLTLLQ